MLENINTMKDIDNKKLYVALKNAKIQGEFTAYTSTEGILVDVQNFPMFSTDAIVKYRWYQDESNYVEVYTKSKEPFHVLLRIADLYLLYDYNDGQITIQKNFVCPKDRRETTGGVLEALTTAFESAKCLDNQE